MASLLIVAAGLVLAWALSFVWALRRVPPAVAEQIVEAVAQLDEGSAQFEAMAAEVEALSAELTAELEAQPPAGDDGVDAAGDLSRVHPAAPIDPAPGARLISGFQRPSAAAGGPPRPREETTGCELCGVGPEDECSMDCSSRGSATVAAVPAAAAAQAQETWRRWNAG